MPWFTKEAPQAAAFELTLMRSAAFYRLERREERVRSVNSLVALFDKLVDASGIAASFEIGAAKAEYSRRLKRRRPDVHCLAFEASPHNYAAFAPAARADGVVYVNKGIGAAPGSLPFQIQQRIRGETVSPIRTNNSFLARTEAGVEYDAVEVPVTTVDAECAGLAVPQGATIAAWVDVEGFAGPVLSGARQTLKSGRVTVTLVEVEDTAYWSGQWLANDVVEHLVGYGLIPVARDFEYPHQYNIVFVNEDLFRSSHLVRSAIVEHFSAEAATA